MNPEVLLALLIIALVFVIIISLMVGTSTVALFWQPSKKIKIPLNAKQSDMRIYIYNNNLTSEKLYYII